MGRDVCTITLCDGQPMGEEALTDVINFAARTNRGRLLTDVINFAARTNRGRLLTDVINFAARTNNTQIIEGGGLQQSKSKADDSKIGISVKNRSKGGVWDV